MLTVVDAVKPDIIGVTESWGSPDISDSELSIPDFDMFRVDRQNGHRGGGVLLYVTSSLNAIEVVLCSKFCDQVWCKVKTRNGTELLVGVCCRSPTPAMSSKDNDMLLCDMLLELKGKSLLLMGDFNFPDVDWSTSHGYSLSSQNFTDAIDDAFLTQQVTEVTCNGAILDLVITSEPDMTDSVNVLAKFANSDHNMLEWDIHLSPVSTLFSRPSLDYAKGNITAIRQTLKDTDWSHVLQGNANEQWEAFHGLLSELESKYIPVRRSCKRQKKSTVANLQGCQAHEAEA